ncbi:hypothetical protein EV182_003786, partial [Spiromyces aspiralis]
STEGGDELVYNLQKDLEAGVTRLQAHTIDDLRPKQLVDSSLSGPSVLSRFIDEKQHTQLVQRLVDTFTLEQLKAYLRHHQKRVSGRKEVLAQRVVKDVWGLRVVDRGGDYSAIGDEFCQHEMRLSFDDFRVLLEKGDQDFHNAQIGAPNDVAIRMDPLNQRIHLFGGDSDKVDKVKTLLQEIFEARIAQEFKMDCRRRTTPRLESRIRELAKKHLRVDVEYRHASGDGGRNIVRIIGKGTEVVGMAKRAIRPYFAKQSEKVMVAATKSALDRQSPVLVLPSSDPVRLSPFEAEMTSCRAICAGDSTGTAAERAGRTFSKLMPLEFLGDLRVWPLGNPPTKKSSLPRSTRIHEVFERFKQRVGAYSDDPGATISVECRQISPSTDPQKLVLFGEFVRELTLGLASPPFVRFVPSRSPIEWLQGRNDTETKSHFLRLVLAPMQPDNGRAAAEADSDAGTESLLAVEIPLSSNSQFQLQSTTIRKVTQDTMILMVPEAASDIQIQLRHQVNLTNAAASDNANGGEIWEELWRFMSCFGTDP